MNRRSLIGVLTAATVWALPLSCVQAPVTRSVQIKTEEATGADVAVSPDGETLVFTLLGHLFAVPIEGGDAVQLTFGPYYDEDPAFAPDGSRIVFASDRGSGESNLYVLNLENKSILPITDEFWAARPEWTHDGRSVMYLSHALGSVRCTGLARVRTVSSKGGESRPVLGEETVVRTIAAKRPEQPMMLLKWSDTGSTATQSMIASQDSGTNSTVIASFPGSSDRMRVLPDGGFVLTLQEPWKTTRRLIRLFPDGNQTDLAFVQRRGCPKRQPRIDTSPDGAYVYLSDRGKLWRFSTSDGSVSEIPFRADAHVEIPPPVAYPEVDLDKVSEEIEIMDPDVSEGGAILFGALAKVWWQQDEKGVAKPLTGEREVERRGVLSPDGSRAALLRNARGRHELVSVRLEDGHRTVLLTRDYIWDLAWHPDGDRIAVSSAVDDTLWIYSVDVSSGRIDTLATVNETLFIPPRPHFSPDGGHLFYTTYQSGSADVLALDLQNGTRVDTVASLSFRAGNILTSPDRDWIAFRVNSGLYVSPVAGAGDIKTALQVSDRGGKSFRFIDPNRIVYSEGSEIREYDIRTGTRSAYEVRLPVMSTSGKDVLIENARIYDVESARFSEPTSLLVEEGRIVDIGTAASAGSMDRFDAGGRFVIPGLTDAHMHVEAPWWILDFDQREYLRYGVTLVRDVGERMDWSRALAQRSMMTPDPIPRYLIAGEMLQLYRKDGELGSSSTSMGEYEIVLDPATARAAVRTLTQRGSNSVKAYATLSADIFRATADEARTLGLRSVAHGANVKEILRCILSGVTFAEHLDDEGRFYDDVQALMAQSGIYWTPTVEIMGGMISIDPPEWYAQPPYQAFFDTLHVNEISDLAKARELGVRLLLGTDDPIRVGSALHTEMLAFQMAGFSPADILDMATRQSAVAFGLYDDLGSIDPGKLADLVILEKNPLEDIRNARSIWRVVKGGWIFDPDAL